jgi:hypothetical protein
MTMALSDRKGRPDSYRHGKSAPLRGNQLAQALAKSGVVEEPKPKPNPYDQDVLLSDLRHWFARLVVGSERVPTSQMTPTASLPGYRRQQIVDRLKARGLIVVKEGSTGGAIATLKLKELARTDVTDGSLVAIALTDLTEEERQILRREPGFDADEFRFAPPPADDETANENVVDNDDDIPPPMRRKSHPPAPIPRSKAARDAKLLADVRLWLDLGARGEKLRIAHISNVIAGNMYAIAYRIRDAGYIAKRGDGPSAWYVVPENMRALVKSLTHEQIAGLIWPSMATRRSAFDVPTDKTEPEPTVSPPTTLTTTPTTETGDAPTAQRDDNPFVTQMQTLDMIATRMMQFVDILARMDARFSRLERELGLKPIEEESSR